MHISQTMITSDGSFSILLAIEYELVREGLKEILLHSGSCFPVQIETAGQIDVVSSNMKEKAFDLVLADELFSKKYLQELISLQHDRQLDVVSYQPNEILLKEFRHNGFMSYSQLNSTSEKLINGIQAMALDENYMAEGIACRR